MLINIKEDGYRFIGAISETTTFLDPYCCQKDCCAKYNLDKVIEVDLEIESLEDDEFYDNIFIFISRDDYQFDYNVESELLKIIKSDSSISGKIEKIKKMAVKVR